MSPEHAAPSLPGIKIERLEPWGDHEPHPAACSLTVACPDGTLTPEQLHELSLMHTPAGFVVTFQFTDKEMGIVGISSVIDDQKHPAPTMSAAVQMGFAQLHATYLEAEAYHLAAEKMAAREEITFETAAEINRIAAERVAFHPQDITITCYPNSWNF